MKKFGENQRYNIVGDILKDARTCKGYTKTELCNKLDLLGVNFDRNEIYRIENYKKSVKDFELVAFCIVLDIDFNDLKKILVN